MVVEDPDDGPRARIAWLIDFYIPENRRRQGFGATLIRDLVELWGRVGVAEAQLVWTAKGIPAYEACGFVAVRDREQPGDDLQPTCLRLG